MNAIANFETMSAIEADRINDDKRDGIKIKKMTIDD